MLCPGIVILNYNNYLDTINCVNSLLKLNIKTKIIVVDNCSIDNSYNELLNSLSDEIILLKTQKNLGYAGGNNVGIMHAKELGCNYICILNNDTIIENDFLNVCIQKLNEDLSIGFIGPTILDYYTKKVQSTGGNILLMKGLANIKNSGQDINKLPPIIYSDYIGGACMVFRTEMIDIVGYIPEAYFLFYEETEWCYKARLKGFKNVCINNTYILHKGSVSIKRIQGLNEYLLSRNRVAFIRRNYSNGFLGFLIYLKLCIFEVIKAPFKGFKNLERIRFYSDGWFKRVDLNRFPFIRIKGDS